MSEGKFKGRNYVKLSPHHSGQKGKSLSLKNHTLLIEHGGSLNVEVIETNDEFGCYKLLFASIHKLIPPQKLCKDGRIFCQVSGQ